MPTAAPTFGARLAASIARLATRTVRPSSPIGPDSIHGAGAMSAPEAPTKGADAVWASEAPSKKASAAGPLIAFEHLRRPVWTPRDYTAFANEGFMQNAIVYRCVRMIAECAGHVPLLLYVGDQEIEDHPLRALIRKPNAHEAWPDFMQKLVGFLLVSGNAYIEVVAVPDANRIHAPDASGGTRASGTTWASEGARIREIHLLRPDRVKVVPGPDGWPEAFDYTVGGRTVRIGDEAAEGVRSVLHVKLFHPTNDHYGLSPLEAAAQAIDLHNTASKWNKALLDNSARPSGAIVYTARDGNLTGEQIERLKSELEAGFQGSANAGRPLLLEGGLDWKAMSLSPKDMDFIEARHVAAREIALALGVPPMLLGIPGDNTYANLAEAQRTFWRQTVLPLVERVAAEFSHWLAPAYRDPIALRVDIDTLPALAGEREALWASLEKTSFLTDAEKRTLAGFSPTPDIDAKRFNSGQPRIPSGQPGGGQWTNGQGGNGGGFGFAPDGTPVDPAQMRRPRGGASRAREQYLSDLTSQARQAADRVREIDPTWREPQSAFSRGDVEGNIRHQQAVRDAAIARLAEITRDALPGANPAWGANRLTKELYDRGFRLSEPTRAPGLFYDNPLTGEQIRIMERPAFRWRNDPAEKHFFSRYYRYRRAPYLKEGRHTPIPDKD